MMEQIIQKLHKEGIALAPFSKRAWAYAIDDIVISLLFYIIFFDEINRYGADLYALSLFINQIFPYIVLVKILYQTIFVALYGQTLGKMALKIRVVNRDYLDTPSFYEAFFRAVWRIVSEVFFYLGFVWAKYNPILETWHDKMAKSIVIDDETQSVS